MRAGWVVIAAALTLAAGCGGGDPGAGDLRWEGKPKEYRSPTLANDHLVQGVVKNDSLRRVDLKAKDLELLDKDGKTVKSSVLFSRGYSHRLQPLDRPNEVEAPQVELLRGVRISLEPGKSAPLTVAWRQPKGAARPVRVDYGTGTLPLP